MIEKKSITQKMDYLNCYFLLAVLLAICRLSTAERVTYSGYTVFRARPQTVKHVEDLSALVNKPVSFSVPRSGYVERSRV